MLTKQEVYDIAKSGDVTRLNEAYAEATEDEQAQLMAWYTEYNDNKLSFLENSMPEVVDDDMIERIEAEARRAPRQPIDSATARNRARAMRGNMLKKLKRTYPPYTLFTPQEAADRTKTSVYDMAAYLANEAQLPGAQIHYDDVRKKYFIMSIYSG